MVLSLWWALAAGASELGEVLLAPDLEGLSKHIALLESHIEESEAVGLALGRVQNRWAVLAQAGTPTCEDPEATSLSARARVLGGAQRDGLQSARSELRRVQEMIHSPTLAPLLDPQTLTRVSRDGEEVDRLVHAWQVSAAYQSRYIERAMGGCEIRLEVGAGIASSWQLAPSDNRSVVVLSAADGWICAPSPESPAANASLSLQVSAGSAALLPENMGCFALSSDCGCTAEALRTAAVLGPMPRDLLILEKP